MGEATTHENVQGIPCANRFSIQEARFELVVTNSNHFVTLFARRGVDRNTVTGPVRR